MSCHMQKLYLATPPHYSSTSDHPSNSSDVVIGGYGSCSDDNNETQLSKAGLHASCSDSELLSEVDQ